LGEKYRGVYAGVIRELGVQWVEGWSMPNKMARSIQSILRKPHRTRIEHTIRHRKEQPLRKLTNTLVVSTVQMNG
jgi:hypothetical protein